MSVLADLPHHLISYRVSVDALLEAALHDPQTSPKRFLEVLIASSKLYLDLLLVWRETPSLYAVCVPDLESETGDEPESSFSNMAMVAAPLGNEIILFEAGYREQVRRILDTSLLAAFTPEDAFSNRTGLCSLEDYTDNLSLHLPEIYAETLRVERQISAFLDSKRESDLSDLLAATKHICFNHIVWVQPALDRLADEDRWSF